MRTTFGRTLITMLGVLLTALLLVGIALQTLVEDYLQEAAMEDLKNEGQVIVELARAYYGEDPISQTDFLVAIRMASTISNADAVICDSEGMLLLCSRSPLGCEHQGMRIDKTYLERVFREDGMISVGVIQGLYEDDRYVVSMPVWDADGTNRLGIVTISSSTAATEAVLDRIFQYFLGVAIVAMFFSGVLMAIFVRQQNKPLRAMAKAARSFGHGDLTVRVKTDGKCTAEVEDLALAFNNMASSLQKGEYQRQEFVANVSHELKTPMTSISGYVDGILDGTIPPEKATGYLQLVSSETKRLNRLVRSMLDISRLQDQGGIPQEQMSRFDVGEAVGQVLISFEQKINEKNLEVQANLPEHPVYTFASLDHITQVIYNLLDNGVKFAAPEGLLEVDVRLGGGKVYVSIANQGQTIPPEELPLVFDRFHKIDKSRSHNRDSWGLGLYIVKTIVCAHGEDISVTSREGKTTFTFTLTETT